MSEQRFKINLTDVSPPPSGFISIYPKTGGGFWTIDENSVITSISVPTLADGGIAFSDGTALEGDATHFLYDKDAVRLDIGNPGAVGGDSKARIRNQFTDTDPSSS